MTVSDWADSDASEAQTQIAEMEHSLSGLRNFSWLVGIVLTLGVCANVYLVWWLSAQRRLSVKWEPFRLTLRYSSLVDLSSCAVIVLFVTLSFAEFHARSDTRLSLQCGYFDLSSALVHGGMIKVSSGVVIAARQATMLGEKEITLVRQNRVLVVKLVRDLLIVGVVFFLGAILVDNFGPVVRLPMCYVVGKMTSHAILLLVAPIFVSALIGAVVIVGSTRNDNEDKRRYTQTTLDISDDLANSAKDVECLMTSIDDTPDQVSDSRWNRFVVMVRVAVLTWFILAAVMTLLVLLQPVTANTFFVMAGISVLISVWSAYALAMHQT